jgi:hypothetical protein
VKVVSALWVPRLLIHRLRYLTSFFLSAVSVIFWTQSNKKSLKEQPLRGWSWFMVSLKLLWQPFTANVPQFLCPFRRCSAAWVILHHLVWHIHASHKFTVAIINSWLHVFILSVSSFCLHNLSCVYGWSKLHTHTSYCVIFVTEFVSLNMFYFALHFFHFNACWGPTIHEINISCRPISWSLRSRDITSLDFFF